MQLPTFHPCVRLARWKEHPGELSFVPPDGRFILAGYETDLMPLSLNTDQPPTSTSSDRIFLPATVDLRPSLGNLGTEFEARLTLNNNFPGVASSAKPGASRSTSNTGPFSFGSAGAGGGSSAAPTLEAVVVTIPFPRDVRAVTELKPSRGEANFNAADKVVEWKIPTKDGASINGVASLSGTVTGPYGAGATGIGVGDDTLGDEPGTSDSITEYYEEGGNNTHENHSRQTRSGVSTNSHNAGNGLGLNGGPKRTQAAKALMPRSIAVSFNVKGWLPSGIKVDALVVDVKKSKGLGDGVRPYKGVKYLTVSRRGVERRVE